MLSISTFLSILALATTILAGPIPARPDITKVVIPKVRINTRSSPIIKASIENPDPVVGRAAPVVDVLITNPDDVVN
ncbi:hypothetical protein ST47_g8281 [Ascochyta rabiei]|uniref:Uncharacterized protein n=2 Tax=Didymella rabiei TaxID=5454 RepID=A0A162ZJI8_DIDRA|nr:hypothetical protein ST47_g8281 [Ascochyta rabiei]